VKYETFTLSFLQKSYAYSKVLALKYSNLTEMCASGQVMLHSKLSQVFNNIFFF